MDPFDLLGLSPSFSLGSDEITRAYLRRAALVHPDLDSAEHSGDDAEAGNAASSAAEALNRAKTTLQNPELRAIALLARLGGPGPEDRSLPPGFLIEMMERREEVEASLASEGAAARARWRNWALERRAAHIGRVGGLFGRAATGGPDARSLLREVRIELNAWRYIERMIEQLEQHEGSQPGTEQSP